MNKPTMNNLPPVIVEITDGYDSDKVLMRAEVEDVRAARAWITANAPNCTTNFLPAWWLNNHDGHQVVDFGSHRVFGRIVFGGAK